MTTQTKPQSFEDRNFFPSFRDCPGEHVWDERYFRDLDPNDPEGPGVNRKHWCLLGEIIQADTFLRPRIVAKDYKGDQFVVAFYPDRENDMPRLLKHFKVGNTIAIFYPLVHFFLDGSIGVRVEESDEVIIIPLNMSEVIAMNKEVIKYTPADGAAPKCHGCDEVKDRLSKCGGCELFFYCNKECQVNSWKEKGHKKFCKVLKDKNVRLMHFLDYGAHSGLSGDIAFS